ncbi:ABC transporter ATP-binding protein [Brachybacterium squillarum]|nr:ABC transporter ATP-binding protein [Brachybacterium squillarum]MCW1805728.1 ABC transporter ATP-binding protein [Brachybacterium squillarum]
MASPSGADRLTGHTLAAPLTAPPADDQPVHAARARRAAVGGRPPTKVAPPRAPWRGPVGARVTSVGRMSTPDAGSAVVLGEDMWQQPARAKARLGVLADGLRTFDRLTGRELLTYVGLLRGMDAATVEERSASLLEALDLAGEDGKLVVDYSAGMTKKILLASALIHAPRLLVLDEPLEAVDPVSAQVIRTILTAYVDGGGTVVLSSHVMELVEGLCSHVAIIAGGELKADGTLAEVRGEGTLVQRFIDLVGGARVAEGSLSWLES